MENATDRIATALEAIAATLARIEAKIPERRPRKTQEAVQPPARAVHLPVPNELERMVQELTEGKGDVSVPDILGTLELTGQGNKMLISRCLTRMGFIQYRPPRANPHDHKRPMRWRRM